MENLFARQAMTADLPNRQYWYESYDGLARQPHPAASPASPAHTATAPAARRRRPKDRTTVAAEASRDLIADFLELGWSMRQIAAAAGISRSAVQQIHAGQSLRVTPKTERSLSDLAENTTTRSPGALVIDAAPSRKMIGELIEGGWSMRQIALVAQVSRSSVRSIQAGDSRRVHVKTERALREVIETLYGIRSLNANPARPRPREITIPEPGERRLAAVDRMSSGPAAANLSGSGTSRTRPTIAVRWPAWPWSGRDGPSMTGSDRADAPVDLDPVDWAILEQLQADSNVSNKDLAARIGLAASTCLERVRRLRERGVITGFHAEVSPAAVGLGLQAILAIQVRPHAREVFGGFVDFVLGLPETRAIYHVSGDADFLLHVATADSRHLQHLVLDVISSRSEVAHVQSSIIFEQVMMSALGPPQSGPGAPPLVARRARARASAAASSTRSHPAVVNT